MADMNPESIRALVQDAIDKGATTVEEVHKQIAAMPLAQLQNVEPLADFAKNAQGILESSIGTVYDSIRQVNEKVGEVAQQLLANVPGSGAGGDKSS